MTLIDGLRRKLCAVNSGRRETRPSMLRLRFTLSFEGTEPRRWPD